MQRMIGIYLIASILTCNGEIFRNFNSRLKKSISLNTRIDQDATETNNLNLPNNGFPQGSIQGHHEGETYENPIEDQQFAILPDYEFGYSVNDETTGDQKSHNEYRRDNIVHGSYFLIEPDGSKRTVFYTAGVHGFNAFIQRDPPVANQNDFYYDQENQATTDGIRDNPVVSNLVENQRNAVENNVADTQNLIVPNIVENSGEPSNESHKNSVSEEKTDEDVLGKTFQSSTENPNIVPEVPEITMSSPRPFGMPEITNIEDPNTKTVTTPVPIDTNGGDSSRPIYGEFPLLAHILPSYAKRYALYHS